MKWKWKWNEMKWNGMEWMNEWMNAPHLRFLHVFCEIDLSLQSRALFPISSSKSAPNTPTSYDFEMEIELSLLSLAHFSYLIFQKSFERLNLNMLKRKLSSRYSLVHSFPTSSSTSAPCASVFLAFWTATLRPQEPPCPYNHRVLRPRVFSPVSSHDPKLLLSSTVPTCELVLLPLWLTWWQDSPWTLVRNLEVCELNFLWLYYEWSPVGGLAKHRRINH